MYGKLHMAVMTSGHVIRIIQALPVADTWANTVVSNIMA